MDRLAVLNHFLEKASKDARIGIAHIGLYTVLFNHWQQQDCEGPVNAYASQIMVPAKVSSSATYHRLIKELHEYEYIVYLPSFYKRQPSKIYLTSKEQRDECRMDYKGRPAGFPNTTIK